MGDDFTQTKRMYDLFHRMGPAYAKWTALWAVFCFFYWIFADPKWEEPSLVGAFFQYLL